MPPAVRVGSAHAKPWCASARTGGSGDLCAVTQVVGTMPTPQARFSLPTPSATD
jgi:hypothetical protein